ncbi:MAG TPA: phospho-sugar mutase [Sumerlaeia bacterium]|nr:phospho-sugar mutase [Sumerlaeia bacterium]
MRLKPEIRERAEQWTRPPFDDGTAGEIQALLDSGDEKELYDRFYTQLEFGTGGLRGVMGAGLNRMNRYTVARATQGLATYVLKNARPGPGRLLAAAIAYDSRIRSDEFARETACVFAGNGIHAFLFDALRPTPELSFAVRQMGASAGVVITASHNPKEYNGYKVYWSDGAQVVPPHDRGIIAEVNAISDFSAIRRKDCQQALDEGLIKIIGEQIDDAYCEAMLPLSMRPDVCREFGGKLKIVYTPLHGAGCALVPEALRRWGFRNVELCPSQSKPDGRFPAAPSPNPEEAAALSAAIDTARASQAHLVLATDPDCDRVGIAVRDGKGDYRLATGNQIAAMLVEYVIGAHAEMGSLLPEAAVVKTIVTTELIAGIARHFGVRLDNVLTGFKYIGEKIRQYEESGEAQYLVGGEESYGYLVGTHARDKDAVVCSCMIAEMAAVSLSRDETLLDRLDAIYRQFGVYQESLLSMEFPGAEGKGKISRIMVEFRQSPPQEILGSPLVEIRDYDNDEIRDITIGKTVGTTGLPKSNVLMFRFGDGTQIVARPSGTEPKIKFYFSVCDTKDLPIAGDEDLARRKELLAGRHGRVRQAFTNLISQVAGPGRPDPQTLTPNP